MMVMVLSRRFVENLVEDHPNTLGAAGCASEPGVGKAGDKAGNHTSFSCCRSLARHTVHEFGICT